MQMHIQGLPEMRSKLQLSNCAACTVSIASCTSAKECDRPQASRRFCEVHKTHRQHYRTQRKAIMSDPSSFAAKCDFDGSSAGTVSLGDSGVVS
jgi:hypothetical protein